jgi:hypothetical protein
MKALPPLQLLLLLLLLPRVQFLPQKGLRLQSPACWGCCQPALLLRQLWRSCLCRRAWPVCS